MCLLEIDRIAVYEFFTYSFISLGRNQVGQVRKLMEGCEVMVELKIVTPFKVKEVKREV